MVVRTGLHPDWGDADECVEGEASNNSHEAGGPGQASTLRCDVLPVGDAASIWGGAGWAFSVHISWLPFL